VLLISYSSYVQGLGIIINYVYLKDISRSDHNIIINFVQCTNNDGNHLFVLKYVHCTEKGRNGLNLK